MFFSDQTQKRQGAEEYACSGLENIPSVHYSLPNQTKIVTQGILQSNAGIRRVLVFTEIAAILGISCMTLYRQRLEHGDSPSALLGDSELQATPGAEILGGQGG